MPQFRKYSHPMVRTILCCLWVFYPTLHLYELNSGGNHGNWRTSLRRPCFCLLLQLSLRGWISELYSPVHWNVQVILRRKDGEAWLLLADLEGYFLRHELVVGLGCSWPTRRYIMIHPKHCVQPWSALSRAPCIRCSLFNGKPFSPFSASSLLTGSVGSQVPEDGWLVGRLWSWLVDLL